MSTPKFSFSAFTLRSTGLANRIISEIKLSKAFDPNNPPSPSYPIHKTEALWDTGSTGSLITKETSVALGLIPTGMTILKHGGGQSKAKTYLVNLYLPNKVGVFGVPVSECEKVEENFGVIIGMDIIIRGDFSITNVDNRTCMSFRIPSMATIDYVEEGKRLQSAGIGRNAPCPCGSGKKFKKCHGKA